MEQERHVIHIAPIKCIKIARGNPTTEQTLRDLDA